MTIESVLMEALRSLVSTLNSPSPNCPAWFGRERELVNLYVFSHLCPRIQAGSALFDPAQVAIEVAVRQISTDERRKRVVCKDLVIWPQPRMTCWNEHGTPSNVPLAIIEFKCRRSRGSLTQIKHDHHDLKWLSAYTCAFDTCFGVSVAAGHADSRWAISIRRVRSGEVSPAEVLR